MLRFYKLLKIQLVKTPNILGSLYLTESLLDNKLIPLEVISAATAATIPIVNGLYVITSRAPPMAPITSPKINDQKIITTCFITGHLSIRNSLAQFTQKSTQLESV